MYSTIFARYRTYGTYPKQTVITLNVNKIKVPSYDNRNIMFSLLFLFAPAS